MEYVILDMEWNQPISKKHYIKSPVNLVGEIIQIGAVKLDSNFCLTDTFKCNVSPKFYTSMNKIVEKITNITSEDLKAGLPMKEAISLFKDFCGNDFIFLTWGFDDVPILKANLKIHKINADWIPEFYNLQLIYTHQIPNEHRQIALETAVDAVAEQKKEAHDALNDAINTYAVCKHLDLSEGLKIYAKELITKEKKKVKVIKAKKRPIDMHPKS